MSEVGTKRLHERSVGHILVGLFVVIVCGGFAWLLMELRGGPERYALFAEFETLGNISEATKVKLRGYTVGRVDGIAFEPSPAPGEPYFLVELGVETAVPVPRGTVAEIRGSGLVGEAFVELVTPDSGAGAPLTPGSRLPGQMDAGMKTLMARLTEAAGKLGGAGASLRDAAIGDRLGALNEDVSRIADQLAIVSNSADSLLRTTRGLVTGAEPSLVRSLRRLDESMTQLATILARTDTIVATTDADVQGTLAALHRVTGRLDSVLSRVDGLLAQKEGQIDTTLSNLAETSASLRQLSEQPMRVFTGTGTSKRQRLDAHDVLTGADTSGVRR